LQDFLHRLKPTHFSSNSPKQTGTWLEHPTPLSSSDILKLVAQKRDVYFAPVHFNGPRRIDYAQSLHWVWADLDFVHPEKLKIRPTITWQSSPGRYQALWELDDDVKAHDAAECGKRMAYAEGADKGGWDITQVLRIPGTRNFKYPSAPVVEILWNEPTQYTIADFHSAYPAVTNDTVGSNLRSVPTAAPVLIARAGHKSQELINNPYAAGASSDRSEYLFRLSATLQEEGLTPEETFTVLKDSSWNKFKGRHDEDLRLTECVRRSAPTRYEAVKPKDPPEESEFVWLSELLASQPIDAGWLIKDIWHADAWGIVGGEAKSYKSMLTLEMAIAVASGEPFLGKFDVHRSGPVLIIQEENDADYYLPDLMYKMLRERGLFPSPAIWAEGQDRQLAPTRNLPIRFLNQSGFNLTDPEHLERVRAEVESIHPVLIIFDPLYSMLGGVDETKAHEVRPILNWLRKLSTESNSALVVCHHWRKKQGKSDTSRAGQRLSGSMTFHNWIVCGLYVERPTDRKAEVVVQREFRRASVPDRLVIQFDIGEWGDLNAYSTKISDEASS
jgi:hypothetical protein